MIVENEAVPHDKRTWLEATALAKAGYSVYLISPKSPAHRASREEIEGIHIYRYPSWQSLGVFGHLAEYAWSLAAQFFLACLIFCRSRFRVIHGCNPPDTIFLIALFFKLFGVKFVFDHHDLGPEFYVSRFNANPRGSLLYRLVCLFEWLTFRTADFSLATNESYREIAITRGEMSPDRVAVVQTCAELNEADVAARQDPPRGAGQFPSGTSRAGQFQIVYVGNMEPQDGLELLLQSADHLINGKGRRDVRFVLVGAGSELPRLQSMAAEMGFNGQMTFAGRIPRRDVAPYIASADVCVAPDPLNPLNDLCSMIKVFEYMVHGKPTVLYDLKEGRRAAGDSALYSKPNDPVQFAERISELLDSDALRLQLGECARRRVERSLNWETQSRRLLQAYEAVLGARSVRHGLQVSANSGHTTVEGGS